MAMDPTHGDMSDILNEATGSQPESPMQANYVKFLDDDEETGVEPAPLSTTHSPEVDDQLAALSTAAALGLAHYDSLAAEKASPEFVEKIPIHFARQHNLIGLATDNGRMRLAIAELSAVDKLDLVSRYLNRPVEPVIADKKQILDAINEAYGRQNVEVGTVLDKMDHHDVLAEIEQYGGHEDLLESAGRAPVIKLVNLILFEAVKQQSSDVHIHPYERRLMIRMRIDGVLYNAFELPKELQEEMVSRVKVMAKMDIAEKRLPQDGRATVQVGERIIDLRIASLPTSYGERVVIRLLDKSARLYKLDELGMDKFSLERFRSIISVEHGMLLVTGPTGSGKTTTLYSALLELNSLEKNILTLEDPIEYQLEGISQTQVSTKKGMTFASGVRSVLRQDPDIIMVGEIRDHETATMAIQSALTGHLVFSTLHTNDAASAITRLLDLGIEPYLVASSVIGVLAQRLVRRICSKCREPHHLTDLELTKLGFDDMQLDDVNSCIGTGCENCRETGYRGRVGLFELLIVDDAIRHHISHRASAGQIKAEAIRAGMKVLRDDGLTKIASGMTTVDEVVRVAARVSE